MTRTPLSKFSSNWLWTRPIHTERCMHKPEGFSGEIRSQRRLSIVLQNCSVITNQRTGQSKSSRRVPLSKHQQHTQFSVDTKRAIPLQEVININSQQEIGSTVISSEMHQYTTLFHFLWIRGWKTRFSTFWLGQVVERFNFWKRDDDLSRSVGRVLTASFRLFSLRHPSLHSGF